MTRGHDPPKWAVTFAEIRSFCLWGKRLEAGRFVSAWQDGAGTREMDYTGLKLLLEGVQVSGYRKRYGAVRTRAPARRSAGSANAEGRVSGT